VNTYGKIATLALAAAAAIVLPAACSAATPPLVWQQPEDGAAGQEAGRLVFPAPGGIATDPATGHVFVSDYGAERISEFTVWGEFVKAWGAGVVVGGAAGSGDLTAGSVRVASVTTTSKEFAPGQPVEGAGVPPGTTIADVGVRTLTLSQPATQSGAGVALTVPEGAGNVPADERQLVTIAGSPSGGSFMLTLRSAETSASITAGSNQITDTRFSAGTLRSGTFHVGDEIRFPFPGEGGVPAGAKVVALGDGSLTISANATLTSNPGISGNETTAPIAFDATAADVQASLAALPAVGAGGVAVSGPAGGPFAVEFKGPLLGDTNFAPLVADASGLTPAGTVGVETVQDGGGALEVCTEVCQRGVRGSAPGEFGGSSVSEGLSSIAIDAGGDVYVSDPGNHRVQKFSAAGAFLSMFGAGVDRGPNHPGDVCTAAYLAGGDTCGAGVAGGGNGQFTNPGPLAVDSSGDVLVGDGSRVQRFGPTGEFLSSFGLPGSVDAMAIDAPRGFLYVVLHGQDGIRKLTLAGLEVGKLPLASDLDVALERIEIATDPSGDVYASYDPPKETAGQDLPGREPEILEFDADGNPVIGPGSIFGSAPPRPFLEKIYIRGLATGPVGAGGGVDIYALYSEVGARSEYLVAYGPPPDQAKYGPPPTRPPSIGDTYAASADTASATVRSQINPHFWTDAAYHVEYGTEPCSQGGCAATAASGVSDRPLGSLVTVGTILTGLQPGTTYHFRFVAQSSGGGPTTGPEATFTTFPPIAPPNTDCPNQAFRSGFGADLADCRAYELVSPLDKNNGDVFPLGRGAFFQAAADGEGFTYPSLTAFGDPQSAPLASRYLARRGPEGWAGRSISPPREITIPIDGGVPSLADAFKEFSPDLSQAWLLHESTNTLAPGAVAGYADLYRRDNLADSYEALTRATPPHREPRNYYPEFQGTSADGSHALFRVADSLTANAPSLGADKTVLYEFTGGKLRLVSILPNGNAATSSSSAGSANRFDHFSLGQSVYRAISADGSTIYWSSNAKEGANGGKLYVRIGGAKTYPVSETASGDPAQFWTASADGSKAFFTSAPVLADNPSDLYEYDLAAKASTLLAHGVTSVIGAGEDGSRLYFVSTEALTGSGPNSQGAEPAAGKPNLYLREGGALAFVATVSETDAAGIVAGTFPPSPGYAEPKFRVSRLTPDGRHLVFMSTAPLTGYDNRDLATGKPVAEVYRYSAADGSLECVSCNPTGVRARGREIAREYLAAARIPVWATQSYPSRVLSDDGSRLFFESFEALVPRDTDGRGDVYEWEEAGSGDCSQAAPEFSPAAGGCVSLISSGKSSSDSEFLDASPDGRDVFILTASGLLPQDYGLIDVYDARAGGGFPPPQGPPAACEGEACQGLPSPPDDPTPASSSFQGAGNVAAKPSRPCPKGKVRRKGRCVAKHHHRPQSHKNRHQTNQKGRAGK
jgi:hypothetical protein